MQSGKLAIHHVGGLWGGVSFSAPSHFDRDLLHVIFEADGDAIASIEEARKNQPSQSIAVHACLAEAAGTASLHITRNPGATSLREIAPRAEHQPASYVNRFGIDFDIVGEVIETQTVETTSLDALMETQAHNPVLPPPDFLSLDTQGTEYEILRGALKSLHSVCGVVVETIFEEAYRGQKRFQDIFDLLVEQGFSFVRFTNLHEAHSPRVPIGLRAAGCTSYGDALFLRYPWKVEPQSKAQLKKLCFFSVVYDHLEFAVASLDRLSDADFDPPPQSAYEAFVADLHRAYARCPKTMPPAFSQILHPDRAREYSRTPVDRWGEIFDYSAYMDPSYLAELRTLQSTDYTEIENLLCKYGFEVLADKVRFNRRHQSYQAEKMMLASRTAREARDNSSGR